MTMIKFPGGGFLKLLHAFLMLLVHLSLVLGFILGARVGDANNIRCLEGERQALLEFKKVLVDDYGKLSSWRSEDEHKNCATGKEFTATIKQAMYLSLRFIICEV